MNTKKNMHRVNYVIATYAGKDTKRVDSKIKNPEPEHVLASHLNQLLKVKHELTQITIMRPYVDPTLRYDNYYPTNTSIEEKYSSLNIVYEECINDGYSNGQWITCYERYRDAFDYYILIEDDYCPHMDNFDTLFIDNYKMQFNDNIGKLCACLQGRPIELNSLYPLHFEGPICISSDTFFKLFDKYPTPLETLNKPSLHTGVTRQSIPYLGGFYQVIFSVMMTDIDIPLKDCIADYDFMYFREEINRIDQMKRGQTVTYHPITSATSVRTNDRLMFIPVQLSREHIEACLSY